MRYYRSYWREIAAPIISRVLEETEGRPEAEIRRALRAAYPFGESKYHPYRIWRDEIRQQRQSGKRVRTLQPGEKLVFPNQPL